MPTIEEQKEGGHSCSHLVRREPTGTSASLSQVLGLEYWRSVKQSISAAISGPSSGLN